MAKDDPKSDPAAAVTTEQLLAVVRELIAAHALTPDKIREIASASTADAFERASGKFWNLANYPAISAFNPKGEKASPRPDILGEVFWLGFLLQKEELTPAEIELVNQLEPGHYHDGQWVVKDLQPGVRDKKHRKLLVLFPNVDQDARANLPSRMTDMLKEMTGQAVAVPSEIG